MWCVAVVSTYLRSEWFVNRTFGVALLRSAILFIDAAGTLAVRV